MIIAEIQKQDGVVYLFEWRYSPLEGDSVLEMPMYKANPAIAKTITRTINDAMARAIEHALPLDVEGFLSTPTTLNG